MSRRCVDRFAIRVVGDADGDALCGTQTDTHKEDGDHIELLAVKSMAAGDEILISYTGDDVDAYTSQRLMVQYGFVLLEVCPPALGHSTSSERAPCSCSAPAGIPLRRTWLTMIVAWPCYMVELPHDIYLVIVTAAPIKCYVGNRATSPTASRSSCRSIWRSPRWIWTRCASYHAYCRHRLRVTRPAGPSVRARAKLGWRGSRHAILACSRYRRRE